MSGYMGRTNGTSGCHFTYVTQMDPRGTVCENSTNNILRYGVRYRMLVEG